MSEGVVIPGGGPAADVPAELRALPQWVGWKLVEDGPKPRKVPVSPATGALASSTDRRTWGTFDAALAGAATGRWSGVGFVFTKDDPYCGIDLDDVIDPATGEIDPDAAATIDRFASYAELSPSGTGVHLIVRGELPPGGRKRGDRECYDRGRYFTVTGLRWTPCGVEERQEVLTAWHAEAFPAKAAPADPGRPAARRLDATDEELVEKVRRSKQGEKFGRLWAGDTAGYGSGSEADLALASILLWWCQGDAARADRLFRSSGLMRPKWDARRGESTYGANTLGKAKETVGSGYDPDHKAGGGGVAFAGPTPGTDGRRFKWASELAAPPAADDWVWQGYLPAGGITLLSAYWKAGKTTLLAHLLRACAAGGDFLGRPLRACKVLYVSEEGERNWVRRRDKLGLGDNVGFYLQPFPTRADAAGWVGFIAQLKADVLEHGFDLVVFDTLAKLWPAREENDAGAVDDALMPLSEVTKVGAAVLLIHHLRKSGGQEYTGSRGSGALSAFPDVIVELTRFDGSDHRCRKRVLKAKGRYDDIPEELVVELGADGLGYVVVPEEATRSHDGEATVGPAAPYVEPKTEEERVVAVLGESADPWMKAEQIREALKGRGWGMRNEDVSVHLSSLYGRDQVVIRGKVRSPKEPRQFCLKTRSTPGCQRERVSGNESESDPDESRSGGLVPPDTQGRNESEREAAAADPLNRGCWPEVRMMLKLNGPMTAAELNRLSGFSPEMIAAAAEHYLGRGLLEVSEGGVYSIPVSEGASKDV